MPGLRLALVYERHPRGWLFLLSVQQQRRPTRGCLLLLDSTKDHKCGICLCSIFSPNDKLRACFPCFVWRLTSAHQERVVCVCCFGAHRTHIGCLFVLFLFEPVEAPKKTHQGCLLTTVAAHPIMGVWFARSQPHRKGCVCFNLLVFYCLFGVSLLLVLFDSKYT